MDKQLSYDEVAALSAPELTVRQIRDWIRSGSLPAGKSLPSELMLDRLAGRLPDAPQQRVVPQQLIITPPPPPGGPA